MDIRKYKKSVIPMFVQWWELTHGDQLACKV